ncbi:alanine racemase [Arthrobacter sulfonylureivorans]|uniref:Alanine racemase n=1 Tax=Arthrobacter sulfonylureivorans TaxID=2486855 RepID=A0ABY3W940_9MICC|nr:alanine racemase [Arthrobacter sulfonylureivorans]UNK46860.1 alanine racemase [Arthrobacter sulfonylureivorans]
MSSTTSPLPYDRQAVINLDAIRANVRHLREIAAPARVMAVVKADAYGHGAIPVARAALEAGAGWLGVAHFTEGLALREAGIDAPILAWLHTPDTDFAAGIEAGIDVGVSGWELEPVVKAARQLERPARVHLKIDTGLGRNGCPPALWEDLINRAVEYQELGLLRVVGVFSHLAVADEPHRPETDEQVDRFREAVAVAENAGLDLEVRHLANTPGTLSRPDAHFDLVRVGLGIYGLSPFDGQTPEELGLVPAMTLRARVANCKQVPPGQGVSYGLNYLTTEPTTLVLVPLGYADGIPRSASGVQVAIAGKRYDVVGRVAMDQFVVDLRTSNAGDLTGEEVILFGPGPDVPDAHDWAIAADTINYEIVTRVSPRVPRYYTGTAEDQDDGGEAAPVAEATGLTASAAEQAAAAAQIRAALTTADDRNTDSAGDAGAVLA